MAEVLTSNETPADQPELNADEQDSLAVAEAAEGEQQQLLAGKFSDPRELEKAYLSLQKKFGEPREEAEPSEEVTEEASPQNNEEEENNSSNEQLSEEQANQLFEMVGGEKAYQSMIQWAGQNLSKEEVQMYDSVMSSGNPSSIYFAVQALNGKFTDAVGNDGQLLTGRSAAETTAVYRSQPELVAAMNDPRYDSDPAYREDVMRKLSNSTDLKF
tara:strand:+ start:5833 stop:6477 length:645 start_codon:yes stop_codon:yes gene_type:complete